MKLSFFLLSLFIFITYIPILSIVLKSFYLEDPLNSQTLSLIWYKKIYLNTELVKAISNSLVVSFFTCLISSILGGFSAISVEFYEGKLKKVFSYLFQAPIYLPDISFAVVLGIFYSYLSIKKSYVTLIISQCILAVGMIHFLIRINLKSFDRNIIKAAFDYGARPLNVVFEIILPQLKSSILATMFFTFVLSFTDFNYALFTSGPGCTTLTTYIYSSMRFNFSNEIYAVFSILFLFLTIFVILSLYYFLKSQTKRTIF